MKFSILAAAAVLLATLGAAGPSMAQPAPLEGSYWKTEDGKFVLRLAECGGEYCGDLVWLQRPLHKDTRLPKLDRDNPDPALRTRLTCGLRLVTGLQPDGDNRWKAGRFYNPDDGNSYGAKMRYDPNADALTLRAYLGVEMLGKNMKLARVSAPEQDCEAHAAAALADVDNYFARTPGTQWGRDSED